MMGRWLKRISETGGTPTDKADKECSVSVVSAIPPHIQKKTSDSYLETRGVLTDKADKSGSVSVVSTLPPRIQKTHPANPEQMLTELAKELRATPHMLRRLLSDDDMQAIAEGEYSRELLADYFKLMERDGKPLVDPQWHLDHLLKSVNAKRLQSAHNCTKWDKAWRAAHELFINHVMACTSCRAPQGRYCETGQQHRQAYLTAYEVPAP